MKTPPPYEIAEVSSTLSTSGVVTHNPVFFPNSALYKEGMYGKLI